MNLTACRSGRALLRARICTAGVLAAGVAVFGPFGHGGVMRSEAMTVRGCHDETLQCSLETFSVRRRVGFVIVSGVVRNVSPRICRAVEVVADAESPAGMALDQASALIDTTDLYPGRASSFNVIFDDHPRIGAVSLRLRRLRSSSLTPPPSLTVTRGTPGDECSADPGRLRVTPEVH